MVLATVVCRGYLEQEHRAGVHENADGRLGLLDWLEEWQLIPETEPGETAARSKSAQAESCGQGHGAAGPAPTPSGYGSADRSCQLAMRQGR